MIVPICVPPPNVFSPKLARTIAQLGHDEVFLIELQGTLDVQGAADKDGQLIGKLNTADVDRPTLTIGHHLLEGKVVALPKPLGVLHKHVVPSRVHTPDESDGEGARESRQVVWDVAAVVKKKIVFAKRPMPMPTAKPASTAFRRM